MWNLPHDGARMIAPYHNDARATAISTCDDSRRVRAGTSGRAGFRSIEIARDSEETQERRDFQIVHFRRVENLPPDLIRTRAHRFRASPVEEQFLVRSRPSPEFFFERHKPMLRDQHQRARDAKRVGPAVRIVEIC